MNNCPDEISKQFYARLAGYMFLLYIVIGIGSMVILNRATGDVDGTSAKLVNMTQHASLMRLTALLGLLTFFIATLLALALYQLTRDQDANLALLASSCRFGEGLVNAFSAVSTLGLLGVAMASKEASPVEAAAAQELGAYLLRQDSSSFLVSASSFAVGSTIYSYLFLRARNIPVQLSWLGIIASIILAIALPLQIMSIVGPPLTTLMWIPMFVYEVALALWLLTKGIVVQTGYA